MSQTQSKQRGSAIVDGSLEARITAVLTTLTKKQQSLARFMLDNELSLAFGSAENVGRSAGVDAATVVRFSRLLGYEGFADLRNAVRASVPEFRTAEEKLSTSVSRHDVARDVLTQVYVQDIRNIEETARRNSHETLAQAILAIRNASSLYVVGLGLSAYVADHLGHQLGLVGIPVRRVPADPVRAATDLAAVSEGDAVVAVSVWRYLTATGLFFQAARDKGATAIAITDSKGAPVAQMAEIVLLGESGTPEFSHSVAALMTLTNVIATGVALSDARGTLRRFKEIEATYARWDVMTV